MAFRARCFERSFEAVADVVVDQCFFGAFNGALYGLQLLGDLSAWPALLDHLDNRLEVAVGAFQTSGNRGMRVILHIILLSSWQDISDPPGRIENTLDSYTGRGTCQLLRRTFVRDKPFNPNEEHMGSTTFGNVTPAIMIGLALPQNITINRAGCRRVRGDGRA